MAKSNQFLDHLLEQLWMAEEDCRPVVPDSTVEHGEVCGARTGQREPITREGTFSDHVEDLLKAKFVEKREGEIVLTATGRERAKQMIRRHRLAEMLLTQVLDIEPGSEQAEVCAMEHTISPRIADRLCSFLGHPPQCPHGRPIPPGLLRKRQEIKLWSPLTEARIGGATASCSSPSSTTRRLDRLGVRHLRERRTCTRKSLRSGSIGETDVTMTLIARISSSVGLGAPAGQSRSRSRAAGVIAASDFRHRAACHRWLAGATPGQPRSRAPSLEAVIVLGMRGRAQ